MVIALVWLKNINFSESLLSIFLKQASYTDNFNAYLALSNFSNFTTNRWCTPNTRFFMGKMGTDTPITRTPITRFFTFQFWKTPITRFFLPSFEKITMKKRVFGVHHLFVVKLEKLDNAKTPIKISVYMMQLIFGHESRITTKPVPETK